MAVLNCIPSVLEMRRFLQESPGRRLDEWKRMDRSTLSLLDWIIKSKRSYIVQDGMVPGATCAPHGANLAGQRTISGLGPGWMQFRFQQGCPEKEHRFGLAVRNVKSSREEHSYRSLYGWHGSSIANWHSIVREGLDFQNVVHGRSFGNGVYFSQDWNVSRGYATNTVSSRAPRRLPRH